MTLQTLAWLSMAAYATHIMEKFTFDWRNWARAAIKPPVEWSDFYVTAAALGSTGIAAAQGPGATIPEADVRPSIDNTPSNGGIKSGRTFSKINRRSEFWAKSGPRHINWLEAGSERFSCVQYVIYPP
jgi:hypothetical protein